MVFGGVDLGARWYALLRRTANQHDEENTYGAPGIAVVLGRLDELNKRAIIRKSPHVSSIPPAADVSDELCEEAKR